MYDVVLDELRDRKVRKYFRTSTCTRTRTGGSNLFSYSCIIRRYESKVSILCAGSTLYVYVYVYTLLASRSHVLPGWVRAQSFGNQIYTRYTQLLYTYTYSTVQQLDLHIDSIARSSPRASRRAHRRASMRSLFTPPRGRGDRGVGAALAPSPRVVVSARAVVVCVLASMPLLLRWYARSLETTIMKIRKPYFVRVPCTRVV